MSKKPRQIRTPVTHPDHFSFEDAILYKNISREPRTAGAIVKDLYENVVINGYYLEQNVYNFVVNLKKEEVKRRLNNMKAIVKVSEKGEYYIDPVETDH